MKKYKFNAIEHIAAINLFRIKLAGKAFTKAELKQTLKEGGIPSNEVFIRELRKTPVLTSVGKDQFKFSTNKPVYYGLLDTVYGRYHKRTSKRIHTATV